MVAPIVVLIVGVAIMIGGVVLTVRLAERKGRDPTNWSFIALFLTPIIALPAVLLLPTVRD